MDNLPANHTGPFRKDRGEFGMRILDKRCTVFPLNSIDFWDWKAFVFFGWPSVGNTLGHLTKPFRRVSSRLFRIEPLDFSKFLGYGFSVVPTISCINSPHRPTVPSRISIFPVGRIGDIHKKDDKSPSPMVGPNFAWIFIQHYQSDNLAHFATTYTDLSNFKIFQYFNLLPHILVMYTEGRTRSTPTFRLIHSAVNIHPNRAIIFFKEKTFLKDLPDNIFSPKIGVLNS